MASLGLVQEAVYIMVGLLLVVAAIAVIAGTVEELINSVGEGTDPVAARGSRSGEGWQCGGRTGQLAGPR